MQNLCNRNTEFVYHRTQSGYLLIYCFFFKKKYFRPTSLGYILRGIIVDDSGNVECTVDNRMNTSNPWTRLPLSSKSCTLIATVPLKNGNPMWTPEKVEFLPQGLALDVADITEDLYMDILDICNEVIQLKRECKNRNAANAAIC